MTLFPDVQKKAQAELDAVVGPGRLPDHSDSDRLPYINALIKETLRWHVAFPVGVAHRTLQDDELDGYFIPAGTTVITNIWFVPPSYACCPLNLNVSDRGILHDPQVYEDPFVFRPERFLGKDDVLDPLNLMFGFGRRSAAHDSASICDHLRVADNTFQESVRGGSSRSPRCSSTSRRCCTYSTSGHRWTRTGGLST